MSTFTLSGKTISIADFGLLIALLGSIQQPPDTRTELWMEITITGDPTYTEP
jgi:hypothetical protein